MVAEPFRQWVIEDAFAAGRPRFEDVGVLFTDNVHDWELYKLRMLNATHSCMAYLMALAGRRLRRRGDGDPRGAAVPRAVPREPRRSRRSPRFPGIRLRTTRRTVLGRFENTGVRDQIARLCIDGTAKFPTFLIPTVERQLELDGPVECAALALAGWARYLATVAGGRARATTRTGERSAAFAARALARTARVPRARPRSSRRRCARARGSARRSRPRPTASPRAARSARSRRLE